MKKLIKLTLSSSTALLVFILSSSLISASPSSGVVYPKSLNTPIFLEVSDQKYLKN
ncbi:hypothetical protein J2S11_002573 [Bacillus horti]|uniref:Uncharacterized protein n=1 Tax=Caldalkalibacillus horti TaxID=77523 RepID=A0ABT9W082_9BACI|nr:hypothetical protein [Bacillus horti]